jgi:uncharacterized protein (TIGR00255 family)
MLISMTGFGRAIRHASFGKITVEIQAVNRKMLDIGVSLPRDLSRYEFPIRKKMGEKVSRGQVSVRVSLSLNLEKAALPDAAFLRRFRESWLALARESGSNEKDVDLAFLVDHLPILEGKEEDYQADLEKCVDEALAQMLEMKKEEGKILFKDLQDRVSGLEKKVHAIEKLSHGSAEKFREKLSAKIREALQSGVEFEERLLREVAFFAEKVDIAEEVTRLASHFHQWKEIVQAPLPGRKLDFLIQEMMREINTIGSKSADSEISKLVVDVKAELEKMREQIQNVE